MFYIYVYIYIKRHKIIHILIVKYITRIYVYILQLLFIYYLKLFLTHMIVAI